VNEAGGDAFLDDFLAFQRRVAFFGYFNSLAQVLLKLTCPGVPDFYQGTELWDFSLVDPDNRRPVDYARRRDVLAEIRGRIERTGPDLAPLAAELLASMPDGRVKAYLIYRALTFRRAHEHLFARGSYLPLEAAGQNREHLCAFARSLGSKALIVAAPRLVARLTGGAERAPVGEEVWADTWLPLPPHLAGRAYRNLYTGEALAASIREGAAGLPLAAVLGRFPVALLECCET
jgi:(1->4)-alpha-D-glucan 1-alpha-D-glucosylmutase